MCSKHVEAWNKLIIKFSASCLILINKYIEMHGQQNIKKEQTNMTILVVSFRNFANAPKNQGCFLFVGLRIIKIQASDSFLRKWGFHIPLFHFYSRQTLKLTVKSNVCLVSCILITPSSKFSVPFECSFKLETALYTTKSLLKTTYSRT